MTNIWDRIQPKYIKNAKEDHNADFAYENLVNTPSLLCLCDENNDYTLDLGSGDGRFTRRLEVISNHIYAIDYSMKMISAAKNICTKTNFIHSDLEQPFPRFKNKFNLITCKLLLMYINDLDNIAKEVSAIMTDNGALVISVTHPLKWIVDQQKGTIKGQGYKGYLSEVGVKGNIAKEKELELTFLNRTIQTYTNTFTKHGFVLEQVIETGVPDFFVIKYPQYLEFQHKPYRLNMKFIKR